MLNIKSAALISIILVYFTGMAHSSDIVAGPEEGSKIGEVTGTTIYGQEFQLSKFCLLYTSPSPRDQRGSRMPSSA